MEETGRHAAFIWAAYGVTFAVLAGLVLRAFLQHRDQRRALARLEGPAGAKSGRPGSGRW